MRKFIVVMLLMALIVPSVMALTVEQKESLQDQIADTGDEGALRKLLWELHPSVDWTDDEKVSDRMVKTFKAKYQIKTIYLSNGQKVPQDFAGVDNWWEFDWESLQGSGVRVSQIGVGVGRDERKLSSVENVGAQGMIPLQGAPWSYRGSDLLNRNYKPTKADLGSIGIGTDCIRLVDFDGTARGNTIPDMRVAEENLKEYWKIPGAWRDLVSGASTSESQIATMACIQKVLRENDAEMPPYEPEPEPTPEPGPGPITPPDGVTTPGPSDDPSTGQTGEPEVEAPSGEIDKDCCKRNQRVISAILARLRSEGLIEQEEYERSMGALGVPRQSQQAAVIHEETTRQERVDGTSYRQVGAGRALETGEYEGDTDVALLGAIAGILVVFGIVAFLIVKKF